MTFKHVKFEDSAVMRSLEKLAKEKGLSAPEPLLKKAALKTDLEPTDNLMENVFKLCAGLKQSGFEKQALELEEKFFAYKQAQTLYETFSEKGEDLVDRAHPDGSHKLEGVDSDEALVETILDQHLKSVKMIEKMPTGKLASSKDVLKSVKTALGGVAEFSAGQLGASIWSRLLGMVGRAAPAIELAGPGVGASGAPIAGAGAAAEVGGAASVGGILSTTIPTAGVAGAAAVAGSILAVIASGIVGGYIGSAIFDHYYAVTDLKNAGDRLNSEIKDIESSLNPNENISVLKFSRALNSLTTLYPIIGTLKSGAPVTLKALNDMKNLSKLVGDSNNAALAIWYIAMDHKDEQWFGALRGFGDVVAAAKNYMEVSSKVESALNEFARDAEQIVRKKVEEQVSSTGGSQANQLSKKYNSVIKSIAGLADRVRASRPTDQIAQIKWLDKVKAYITAEMEEFNNVNFENKESVIGSYSARLNDAISKLNAFEKAKLA